MTTTTTYIGVHITKDSITNRENYISSYQVHIELSEDDFETIQRGNRIVKRYKNEVYETALKRYNNAHNCNIDPFDFYLIPRDELSALLNQVYPRFSNNQ